APVPPPLRGELVEQLRPEVIQVLAQPGIGDERERIPLAGRGHGHERRPVVRVTAVIARRVRARQVLGGDERRVPALEQQVPEAEVPCVAVYARSNSLSMGMPAVPRKSCRSPRVCPTSCITSSFSAWPMYSRGTGPPGAIAPLAASVARSSAPECAMLAP